MCCQPALMMAAANLVHLIAHEETARAEKAVTKLHRSKRRNHVVGPSHLSAIQPKPEHDGVVIGSDRREFTPTPGDLDQSEAVTAMSVVRYLRARETYDPPAIKDNFELAQLLSTGDAARELVELYSPANARNPVRLLGRGATVAIGIKSIQFPNQRTAIVRFSTRERSATSAVTSHWTALIRFRYTRAPMRNEWRFDNPLGSRSPSTASTRNRRRRPNRSPGRLRRPSPPHPLSWRPYRSRR